MIPKVQKYVQLSFCCFCSTGEFDFKVVIPLCPLLYLNFQLFKQTKVKGKQKYKSENIFLIVQTDLNRMLYTASSVTGGVKIKNNKMNN